MNKKFILKNNVIGDYNIIQICHNEYNTSFSVIPELGGSLNSLIVNGQNILVAANTISEIENQTINAFAGAQLFPYPNRIKDGKYSIGNKTYQLPINDYTYHNSIHGLVYNKTFKVVSIDENNGVIKLRYNYNCDDEGYPFHFVLENSFQLTENTLTITTSIANKSNLTIPVGHGWHPYFNVNNTIDKAYLQIASRKYYPADKQFIPTGKTTNFDSFLKIKQIAMSELDHCFKIEGDDIIAQLIYPDKNLTISLLTDGYPYLQVYTPSHRNSIALEPQTSIPDAFNNKIGCINIEPNKKIDLKFQIIIT